MSFFFAVQVDATRGIAKLEKATQLSSAALRWAAMEFEAQAPNTIRAVFMDVMPKGNKGFPEEYAIHVLTALTKLPVIARVTEGSIAIGIDFDSLGSYSDLIRGFHYGAATPDGDQIDLPYGGEALKNDPEARYAYWQKVVDGDSKFLWVDENGRTLHIPIPEGAFNETIAKRVAVWGEQAPEWLILQYGIDYYPMVTPRPIRELLVYALEGLWYNTINNLATIIVEGASPDSLGRPRITVPHRGNRWIRSA